jgi:hypothetical protein
MQAKTFEVGAPPTPARQLRSVVTLLALTLLVAACGESKKDNTATQTAVRVNKEELTVHQINLLLQQQRGLKPEQVDAASRRIVEFLVDQELAVQRAKELKLDQDARVLLQLDAAKREVLARAYAEKVGEAVAKPSAEDIQKYFENKPALFKAASTACKSWPSKPRPHKWPACASKWRKPSPWPNWFNTCVAADCASPVTRVCGQPNSCRRRCWTAWPR